MAVQPEAVVPVRRTQMHETRLLPIATPAKD
jgi:hypothetical protein